MRNALYLGAFAFMAMVVLPAIAQAQAKLTFEAASPFFAEYLQPLSNAINPIGKELAVDTPKYSGRYKTHAGVIEAVRDRQVAGGIAPLAALLKDPASAYDRVPGISLGYQSALQVDRAQRQTMIEAVQPGIDILATVPGDPVGLFTKSEVKSLYDLKGKNFGVLTEVDAAFARAIGANPVFIPAGMSMAGRAEFDAVLATSNSALQIGQGHYYPLQVLLPIRAVFINREMESALSNEQRAHLRIGAGIYEREIWMAQRQKAAADRDQLARNGAPSVRVMMISPQMIKDVYGIAKILGGNLIARVDLLNKEGGTEIKPALDCRLVKMIFATNRKLDTYASKRLQYGYEPAELSYGIVNVGLPYRYDTALPKKKSCGVGPVEDITVLSGHKLSQAEYEKLIQSSLQKKPSVIFPAILIHGYANNFEAAASGAAGIVGDMSPDAEYGLFFSWPSQGEAYPHQYFRDEKRIESAYESFLTVITRLSRQNSRLSLIAHSMGSRVVVDAFSHMGSNQRVHMPLVFVAPDVDAGNFARIQNRLLEYKDKPFTIYASANDLALGLSKMVHQKDRVGFISGRPFVMEPFDLVDATTENRTLLAHSYLDIERNVISDVRLTIDTGKKAEGRNLPVTQRDGQTVFTLRRTSR